MHLQAGYTVVLHQCLVSHRRRIEESVAYVYLPEIFRIMQMHTTRYEANHQCICIGSPSHRHEAAPMHSRLMSRQGQEHRVTTRLCPRLRHRAKPPELQYGIFNRLHGSSNRVEATVERHRAWGRETLYRTEVHTYVTY